MLKSNTPLTFAFYIAQRLTEKPFAPVGFLFLPILRLWYPNSIYTLIFFDIAACIFVKCSSLYSTNNYHLIPGLNQAFPDYNTLCQIFSDQSSSSKNNTSTSTKPQPYTATSIFNPPPTIEADVPSTPKNFSLVFSVSSPYPAAERAGITFSLILFEKSNIPAFIIPVLSLLYYLWSNFCNQ